MSAASVEQQNGPTMGKRLPTNWIAPERLPYRESILNDADIKAAILSHKKQEYLGRDENERMKNSFKKQLCIDMLRQGYHKSFRELDSILKFQIEDRYRLGSEHPVWDRPLLDQEHVKLEYLGKKLKSAEASESNGDFKDIYLSLRNLADYFLLTDDNWLADYFYEKCLNLCLKQYASLGPQVLAEAQCNLGLAYERRESYFASVRHFQEYYNLTNGTDYVKSMSLDDFTRDEADKLHKIKSASIETYLRQINDDDDKLFTDACIHLQRLYKIMSKKYAANISEKIDYLSKVYDVCKNSSIGILEGEASYLLGNAYLENENMEIALTYFHKYYDISKNEKNYENLGKAAEALAKCYEKLGQVKTSIEYLQNYLKEVADQDTDRQYSSACSCLANIYNSLGNYDLAADLSKKSFNIARQMNHRDTIEYNRVLYGLSRAHKNLSHFNLNVELGTRKSINNLMKWKYESEGESLLSNLDEMTSTSS